MHNVVRYALSEQSYRTIKRQIRCHRNGDDRFDFSAITTCRRRQDSVGHNEHNKPRRLCRLSSNSLYVSRRSQTRDSHIDLGYMDNRDQGLAVVSLPNQVSCNLTYPFATSSGFNADVTLRSQIGEALPVRLSVVCLPTRILNNTAVGCQHSAVHVARRLRYSGARMQCAHRRSL